MKNEDFLKSMNIANSNMVSETEIEILRKYAEEFQDDKWQFHLDSVVMGYPDLETQANGYFNGGDSFGQDTLGANLYKLADNLYVVEEEDYDESGTLTIFDNEEKAKKYLSKQENILYPSIETEIENFLDNLEGIDTDDVEVEAFRSPNHNYQDGGIFVEYQVMYKNFIIEDKGFSLNPEKAAKEINDFIEFEKELAENEYTSLKLVSCEQLSKSKYLSIYKTAIEDMITGQIYESTNEVDRVHSPTETAVGTAIHELWDTIENDREEEKQKTVERGR